MTDTNYMADAVVTLTQLDGNEITVRLSHISLLMHPQPGSNEKTKSIIIIGGGVIQLVDDYDHIKNLMRGINAV